jgi:kinesin family member 20
MRDTLSSGPDVIPVTELGAVARRITFSCAATPAAPSAAAKPSAAAARSSGSAAGAVPEPISVVLRVRPLSAAEAADGPPAVRADLDRPGVVHVVPRNPALHNASVRANARATFRFSQVFGADAGQERLFRETTAPLVAALFEGTNGLVFAYGTSNAGKTYTIQGEPAEPGILPRSLDVIFNSIAAAKAGKGEQVTADGVSDTVAALVKEEDRLVGAGVAEAAAGPEAAGRSDVFAADRVRDTMTLDVSPEPEYAVSVSYLEIYNEHCFDLLVRPRRARSAAAAAAAVDESRHPADSALKENYEPPKPARPLKRTVLKLKENRALGEVYADGLREVSVSSVADVQRLLSFGQRNRSVAETGVNAHSSRSHTIFAIKLSQRLPLARKSAGHAPGVRITTSKLSIVDLAGNERSSRTGNVGQRLKEASLINTSLMNLGHCLEAMRQNQRAAASRAAAPALSALESNVTAQPRRGGGKPPTRGCATGGTGAAKPPAKVTVPFRQSRLTRLFQHSLEAGAAVMIANVSPAVCDADETIHSLRRAAIAREVSTLSAPNRARTVVPDTSRLVSPSLLRDVEKKYETRATADLRKIAGLEAENALLRTTIEEDEMECDARRAQFEAERQELEGELDELCRKNEMLLDRLAHSEGLFAARECELREEITQAAEKIMAQRDERHRQALADMFEEGQLAAQARVNVVTMTARKERQQLAERRLRQEEGDRHADARRVSMAINLTSVFAEEDEDEEGKEGEEGSGGGSKGSDDAGAGVDVGSRELTLDDLDIDEEEYEFDEEAYEADEGGGDAHEEAEGMHKTDRQAVAAARVEDSGRRLTRSAGLEGCKMRR